MKIVYNVLFMDGYMKESKNTVFIIMVLRTVNI